MAQENDQMTVSYWIVWFSARSEGGGEKENCEFEWEFGGKEFFVYSGLHAAEKWPGIKNVNFFCHGVTGKRYYVRHTVAEK